MLEIAVKPQKPLVAGEPNWTFLDTTDVGLEMSFGREILDDVTAQTGDHSLSFDLPFSTVNDRFFQHSNVMDTSVTPQFNWLNNTECVISDNSIPVLEGILNLESVDLQGRKYSCVVYGNQANIFQELKGRTWRDIFTQADGTVTQDLNFAPSAANVVASYSMGIDITSGNVGNGTITFPLIDKGVYQESTDRTTPYTALGQQYNAITADLASQVKLLASSQLPAIKVEYLIDQLADYLGYTVSNEGFMDTSGTSAYGVDKLYMVVAGKDFKKLPLSPTKIQKAADQIIIGGSAGENFVLFDNESSPFYDPEQLWSNGYFTAPYGGTFTFRLNLNLSHDFSNISPVVPSWAVSYTNNGAQQNPIQYSSGTPYSSYPLTATFDMSVQLSAGDIFAPTFQTIDIVSGFAFTVLAGSTIEIIAATDTDATVDMVGSLGTETVDKWLKAILTQFNLVIETDDTNKVITFWGRDQFYADNPVTIDWTKNIDTASPFVVKPYTDVLSRTTTYTNAEGEDSTNLYSINQKKKVYGTYERTTTVDLAQGDRVVGDYFVPYRAKRIPYNYQNLVPVYDSNVLNATMMRMWADLNGMDGNLQDVDNGPMLFFYGGFAPSPYVDLTLHDSGTLAATAAGFPIAKSVSETSQNYTLNWNSSSTADAYTSNTSDGLFARFHRVQYNERHSTEARIVTCSALLQPEDVANLRYNEIIFIAGSYYLLVSIDNYAVGEEKLCNLTLRKYLGGNALVDQTPVDGCLLLVSGFTAGFEVLWTDLSGNPQDEGSAVCCEELGGGQWFWNEANKTCYTQEVDIGDGDEGGVDEGGGDEGSSGGSGGGTHGPEDDFPQGLFLPDSNADEHKRVQSRTGARSTEVKFMLTTQTTGNTPAIAHTKLGNKRITMLPDMIVGMTVEFVAKVTTAGSSYGQMLFGKSDATVRTTANVPAKPATDNTIFDNGDIPSASIEVKTIVLSGVPKFFVECTGHNLLDLDWTINVVARAQDIREVTNNVERPIMQFQDGNNQIFMNTDVVQFNNVIT
ncbi:MAG: hypothetical protein CMI60_11365 [Parvibaculum sp.]|nr:hypothetical protein [Parvibaculum sp.]